jgi:dihydrodipicolinate synthase/N-acetylneuraminate lyase
MQGYVTEEEHKFLAEVASRATDQEMLQAIIAAAVSGVRRHAEEVRKHAVDMEVVASMALNSRLFKGNEKFVAEKLEQWKHMNGLKWDDQIAKLRGNT